MAKCLTFAAMIELCRHIEAILLDHSCVIVPGLGGFVTQYVPARLVDDEQLIFPPYRSVAFNPSLTMNDGLLAQSYMYARGVAYGEALRLISAAVAHLEKELHDTGRYELPGIGELRLNEDGRMEFQPTLSGVVDAALYGLDAFSLEKIGASAGRSARKPGAARRKASERHYTLRVQKEFVRYVVAAVTAVVFYAVCVFPTGENFDPTAGRREAAVTGYTAKAMKKKAPAPAAKADPAQTTHKSGQASADADAVLPMPEQAVVEPNAEPTVADAVAESGFTIVLASHVSERNARIYAERLVCDGYDSARVYERGRMRRVVYGTYASEAEAQAHLRRLRSDERFAEGWVIALQ